MVDTAGLRNTADAVEAEGVNRARRAMAKADLVLWVMDDRGAPSGECPQVEADTGAASIVARNKADLSGRPTGRLAPGVVRICALSGEGVDALATEIKHAAGYRAGEGGFTARARHLDALAAAPTRRSPRPRSACWPTRANWLPKTCGKPTTTWALSWDASRPTTSWAKSLPASV